jgi:bacillithiol system protein YtxJ
MIQMTEITTLEEWTQCLDTSAENPFFVFKHSTTCPISARAKDRVDTFLGSAGDEVPEFLLVKVIESRNVSNEIGKQLTIRHQSPQLILVKDNCGVWNTSHHLITEENIQEALAQ